MRACVLRGKPVQGAHTPLSAKSQATLRSRPCAPPPPRQTLPASRVQDPPLRPHPRSCGRPGQAGLLRSSPRRKRRGRASDAPASAASRPGRSATPCAQNGGVGSQPAPGCTPALTRQPPRAGNPRAGPSARPTEGAASGSGRSTTPAAPPTWREKGGPPPPLPPACARPWEVSGHPRRSRPRPAKAPAGLGAPPAEARRRRSAANETARRLFLPPPPTPAGALPPAP